MLASDNKQEEERTPGVSARRRWVSVIGFAVGVVLLAAAVYTLLGHRATLEEAWVAARGASPLLVVACIVLPLLNWLATAATIWVLTGRFGKVRFWEMAALIGAAWLLNMLPMRPGMLGRVAYHKKYNVIRVRDSVRVIVAALLCTGCALALLLLAVSLAGNIVGTRGAGVVLVGPLVLLAASALLLRGRGNVWRWPAAIGFRYVDMATWGVRYALVFALIGRPVGVLGAGALTAVGQLAMLTPVQFGLREWAIGMASASLPGEITGLGPVRLADAAAPGLLADCIMRAAELLIVLPVGLTASAWLWRRMRAVPATKGAGPDPEQLSGPADQEKAT